MGLESLLFIEFYSDLDNVQTQSNLAGTPRYMAPEAYRDELCTEKIDIYSFAMLTWEMLTGQVSV